MGLCLFWYSIAEAKVIPNLDNAELTTILKQNQGKAIMINFFATWCPPCRLEIPELIKLRNSYPEGKLLLIGLSVDEDMANVVPFMEKLGINYPVYMAQKSVTDAYNISSVPHNTFYAKNGNMIISEPGMADFNVLQQVVSDLLGQK